MVFYYGCFYHRSRGAKACANALTAPMDEINTTVLEGLRRKILTPDLLTGAVEDLLREWQAQAVEAAPRREDLERELRTVDAEIAGLEGKLATGAPPAQGVPSPPSSPAEPARARQSQSWSWSGRTPWRG